MLTGVQTFGFSHQCVCVWQFLLSDGVHVILGSVYPGRVYQETVRNLGKGMFQLQLMFPNILLVRALFR
jgi:hypothetical protein